MKIMQILKDSTTTINALASKKNAGKNARSDQKHFTRNRKLTYERLLLLILNGIKLSLQLATDKFFEKIGRLEDVVSKQAVSKARTNLDPQILKDLFLGQTNTFCKCTDSKIWNCKYRLCAIDGSDIALDNATELKEFFGCSGRAKAATTAMLSTAFDPLNNWILDASLDPYKMDERTAAKRHIENVMKLPLRRGLRNLFIMDRGYPSREFMAYLIDQKQTFMMRVRNKFDLDFDGVKTDARVAFTYENKVYHIRVIKVTLVTGEVETLVTNLTKKELKTEDADAVYFERWGVETKYDSLKNKLQLGNFSGRRIVTVMQDFWALMFIANTMACVEFQSDDLIAENNADKSNKYRQTTNENRLVEKFCERFIKCVLEPSVAKRDRLFADLAADIARRPVEVKPGRTAPRKMPRKIKYPDRRKLVGLS